ncbi:amidophosphoribosyltransferase [Amycolatopsis antarctica]|uniref:Amidophosphoribosyltransferase n=2 Tax=Amycolatopsis antarctica TaxID=1854586 RepID=A0A263D5M4_9PSEU|nr:amidophosphoribosyltransferase [Amycolatopsis antarctica]
MAGGVRTADRLRCVRRVVLDTVLPPCCAGCGLAGAVCCAGCASVWDAPRRVTRGATEGHAPVYALAPYRGVARRIVLAHKERGRRDLTGPLGAALARALPNLPGALPSDGQWWLVPVPSRRSAARARGGPHVHALARRCAAVLASGPAAAPAAVAPALRLTAGARDAVGLAREQRAANLAGRLRLVPAGAPPGGTSVVLLDDVVTTGVTAAACTSALAAAGITVGAVLALTAAG